MSRSGWLLTGYAAGVATAVIARRRLRRAAQRYAPEQMRRAVSDRSRAAGDRVRGAARDSSQRLGRTARQAAEDIREALADGRAAMRRTEQELRS